MTVAAAVVDVAAAVAAEAVVAADVEAGVVRVLEGEAVAEVVPSKQELGEAPGQVCAAKPGLCFNGSKQRHGFQQFQVTSCLTAFSNLTIRSSFIVSCTSLDQDTIL